MARRLAGVVAVALWQISSAINVDLNGKPGQVVKPEIVIPGEWMMDKQEHFVFLPLTVPDDVAMSQCKVMSNGDSLLVVVTQTPQEEPETNALRKYKLVIEALKKEVGHDETLLQTKLGTWYDTEDDDEVKTHIKAAMDSLDHVQKAKKTASAKSVTVSLGLVQPAAVASSVLQLSEATATPPWKKHTAKTVAPPALPHALPAVLRGSTQQKQHHHAARVIKESFAVEVPFPVPIERMALLKTSPSTLMVAMPLVRKSLEASGISTGGKAFTRIPTFDKVGQWIAGPKMALASVTPGLDLAMAVTQAGLEPLSD